MRSFSLRSGCCFFLHCKLSLLLNDRGLVVVIPVCTFEVRSGDTAHEGKLWLEKDEDVYD
jgi:hypothetical protein